MRDICSIQCAWWPPSFTITSIKLLSYFQFLDLPLLNNFNFPAKILILNGLIKYFHTFFHLLYLYYPSTLPLLTIYYNSTSQICVHYAAIRIPYSAIKTSCWSAGASACFGPSSVFIPKVGTPYSQGGNSLFPGWECFIPKVGIIVLIASGG